MSSSAPSDADALQVLPEPSRRRIPWLLVEVDGSSESHAALVWALREAARREATVVAVIVLPAPDGDALDGPDRLAVGALNSAHERLDDALRRAVAETGLPGLCRPAVLERPVFDALSAAVHGSDLVVVGAEGKRLLRPALPRLRHMPRGA